MKLAAVYARYSSDRQRETSIADQIAVCRQAAVRLGFVISAEHVYTDAEISGSVAQRPGYHRLMDASRTRAFDAIIVEAQDRLWRDQGEAHLALRRFGFWEVKVFDASTGAELTSKTGKVIATVVGLKDEIYLDDLADKTRRGMLGQVRRGFSPGGRPYGYRSDPITDPTRTDVYGRPLIIGSKRVIDPDQAEVVRRIYRMSASGWSAKRIAAWLNEQRIPPPRLGQLG